MPTLVQDILRVEENGARHLERQEFSKSFGQTIQVHPQDRCVHELFETQVEQSPEAVALVAEGQKLSYRELNTRANQLARFLGRFGVGPNSLVGLCAEQSAEMIIGILGILKAGAAYVPMDPSSSRDRLSIILEEANIFVVLTQSHLLEALPRHDGPRLSLDSNWEVIARERKTTPPRRVTPKNLAYVVYTSISPGPPKGVMISHRGLLNYLSWGAEAYEVAKGSGTKVDSSISLDLAITRVLSLLMFGRSIFLDVGRENLLPAGA
jgi:non-ribosomal peptide synthetase component F